MNDDPSNYSEEGPDPMVLRIVAAITIVGIIS
jgi:hypothetical protein